MKIYEQINELIDSLKKEEHKASEELSNILNYNWISTEILLKTKCQLEEMLSEKEKYDSHLLSQIGDIHQEIRSLLDEES